MNSHEIFCNLDRLGIIDLINGGHTHGKSESAPYMDLNFDFIHSENRGDIVTIALAHNFVQNGDVMADPDMTIAVYRNTQEAQALTYRLDSMGVYQRVHSADGKVINLGLKVKLNTFLDTWLKNALAQGHKFEVPVKEPDWSLRA